MSEQNTPQNEEVDLGQLFKLIGNMFTNFFNFIGNIFKGLFNFLILVLIHFYKGAIWYISAIVIGVIGGYLLDKNADSKYGAQLYIETNFDSARQVYENIQNLHQLAYVDKDYEELKTILDISIEEAKTLRSFSAQPDIDENKVMMMYSEYIFEMDSVSKLSTNYIDFKSKLRFYNYQNHRITVIATDKKMFKNLQSKLSRTISLNPYLEQIRDATQDNFKSEEASLEKQAVELDSLSKQYLKIRIAESQKEQIVGAGTNLFLEGGDGGNGILVDESKLVSEIYKVENMKQEVHLESERQKKIVNVIADFPTSGYDLSTWTDKMKFVLPIVFFLITFCGSIVVLLRKYLGAQEKLLSAKE